MNRVSEKRNKKRENKKKKLQNRIKRFESAGRFATKNPFDNKEGEYVRYKDNHTMRRKNNIDTYWEMEKEIEIMNTDETQYEELGPVYIKYNTEVEEFNPPGVFANSYRDHSSYTLNHNRMWELLPILSKNAIEVNEQPRHRQRLQPLILEYTLPSTSSNIFSGEGNSSHSLRSRYRSFYDYFNIDKDSYNKLPKQLFDDAIPRKQPKMHYVRYFEQKCFPGLLHFSPTPAVFQVIRNNSHEGKTFSNRSKFYSPFPETCNYKKTFGSKLVNFNSPNNFSPFFGKVEKRNFSVKLKLKKSDDYTPRINNVDHRSTYHLTRDSVQDVFNNPLRRWNGKLSYVELDLFSEKRLTHIGTFGKRYYTFSFPSSDEARKYNLDMNVQIQCTSENYDHWVTRYNLSYYVSSLRSGKNRKGYWVDLGEFEGNTDRINEVLHKFDTPIFTQYIRITPLGFITSPSFQIALYNDTGIVDGVKENGEEGENEKIEKKEKRSGEDENARTVKYTVTYSNPRKYGIRTYHRENINYVPKWTKKENLRKQIKEERNEYEYDYEDYDDYDDKGKSKKVTPNRVEMKYPTYSDGKIVSCPPNCIVCKHFNSVPSDWFRIPEDLNKPEENWFDGAEYLEKIIQNRP